MSSPSIDFVGKLGDPTTQGLGRVISQYVNSPRLTGLLDGIYTMAQDLDNLMQRFARILNPNDNIYYTPDGGATYPVNTNSATGDQLRIIGQLVGVTKQLPGGGTLDDAGLWQLVMAKIYRNSAVANNPGLRRTLWWIFDPTNALAMQNGAACSSAITLLTIDLGTMATHVALIYPDGSPQTQPTATQLALLHLPAGRSNLPYGLLARPSGTELSFQWQPTTNVYGLTDLNPDDPAASSPLLANSCDWSLTTGLWATAFV